MASSQLVKNSWEIPDGVWEKIEPVLVAGDPPKATGRKRVDQRQLLNGVVYKFRSGCRWNGLPKELGDDSTVHRAFQRWVRLGLFAQLWDMLTDEMDDLKGVAREWPEHKRSSDTLTPAR